jgi:hypothetical protein
MWLTFAKVKQRHRQSTLRLLQAEGYRVNRYVYARCCEPLVGQHQQVDHLEIPLAAQFKLHLDSLRPRPGDQLAGPRKTC